MENPINIPADFFITNRQQLVSTLPEQSLCLLFSNSQKNRTKDQYYPFRQNSDFYYLTGIQQEESVLLINPSHPNPLQQEVLFILIPDGKMEIYDDKKLTFAEAQKQSGIKTIMPVSSFVEIMTKQVDTVTQICSTVSETVFQDTLFDTHIWQLALKQLPQLYQKEYHSISEQIIPLRLKKKPFEITCLKKSCQITGDVICEVLPLVSDGITEYEIDAKVRYAFMKRGIKDLSFEPIIASGKNALRLHYTKKNSICSEDELLLFDMGCEYHLYCSDCSRTVPVSGTFSESQKKYYELVLRVYRKAVSWYVKGNTIAHINRRAWLLMREELCHFGLLDNTLWKDEEAVLQQVKPYLPHGIAHFVGLDTHDVGASETVLEEGMVLTCEPGLYIQEEGIGIRIETMLMITEDAPYDFFPDVPITVDEIEQAMKVL